MAGNTTGKLFCLTTFGESHGEAIGGVIDGCPPGLKIDMDFIQNELEKRKPGQSFLTTKRKETDKVEFLSGIFNGKTTGAPIGFIIKNIDKKTEDYEFLKDIYRPSHADYTYEKKYGVRDYRGGGRASARETAARVVGGAVAKIFLKNAGIKIFAYVSKIGNIELEKDYKVLDFEQIEKSLVRCPDKETSEKMIDLIKNIKDEGDSIGGIISCVVQGVPVGLGEPVFDKLQADLAKAMMSINAAKGFEYGAGFKSSGKKGSELNDSFIIKDGEIITKTNNSGGIQGGISNGQDIYFNVAFKPVPTIKKQQQTIDKNGKNIVFSGKGRHDVCIVPRAVPIVEAMTAIVLADHFLRFKFY
ncbi:MAG: chorismate synthase [Bacteroidetes bacterium]|jgi:chorismate synthase|nr:chorismate synthase [Bacteroidota bacterium]MCK4408346.1 chorismate synthase [Bacteroidales bacterium]